MSGTFNAAKAGAELVPEARVTHVNTRTLSAAGGWQVGAAVGLDQRFGTNVSTSFQLGTRWGQFTSLSVNGLLPSIGFEPAMHGWIDLSFRANYGL